MRIKMCGIHVFDPAAAYDFYTGTLGFTSLMAEPEMNMFIVQSPGVVDGPGLLLEPSDNPLAETYRSGLYQSEIPVIVFGVPDVQAEYLRLSALGVRFKSEPVTDAFGSYVALDDGCGNYVQLHQD